MNLMKAVDKYDRKTYCIAWLPDGKSFVIRDKEEFKEKVLSKYFKATKFSSFTRKLYRWGFRQVNRHIGPNDPIIFGSEHFQRDNEALMANMRSVTAQPARKQPMKKPVPSKKNIDQDPNLALIQLLQNKALQSSNPLLERRAADLSLAARLQNTGTPGLSGLGIYDILAQEMQMRNFLLGHLRPVRPLNTFGLTAAPTDIFSAATKVLNSEP